MNDVTCIYDVVAGEINDAVSIKLADINQDGYVDRFDGDLLMSYVNEDFDSLPYDNSNANKITYDLNGGKESKRNQRYYLEFVDIYAPTRDGYTFIGWTGSNGKIPETNFNRRSFSGDLHFKANWQKNS